MRILVTTDFSTSADNARALVAGLDLPAGSVIRLVHVIEPMPDIAALVPMAIATIAEAAESETQAELDKIAPTLRAAGREVQTAIRIGRAADEIIAEAEAFAPELIVIGSRGRGGAASAVLGSVSAEIVDRASCPVLVARRPALARIVLADDGSDSAAIGARLVTDLPAPRRLPVRVVSVVDAPFPYSIANADEALGAYSAIRAYYDSLPILRETHERIARDRAHRLSDTGLPATSEVREGDAALQLVEAAEDARADCIVVGSHGRTGFRRFVLGSVARGVLFHAKCSVLVTKMTAVKPAETPTKELVTAGR